ncbi:hypothetical protein [Streptomyces sp. NPDC059881]|uniref:hypothetical protein n=1 Tax=Streptomyces sp. NPDC059881 TaxID=3346986 RepID=UPI00364C2B4D
MSIFIVLAVVLPSALGTDLEIGAGVQGPVMATGASDRIGLLRRNGWIVLWWHGPDRLDK